LISIENNGPLLDISYINKQGQVQLMKTVIPDSEMFNWEICPKAKQYKDYRTWDGQPVCKKQTPYLNNFRISEYLNFTLEEEKRNLIFDYDTPPNIYFIDIETEIKYGFPNKNNPVNGIVSISIVDENNKVLVLGLKDLTPEEHRKIQKDIDDYFKKFDLKMVFKYKKYESEKKLLIDFLSNYVRHMAAITGWNFKEFDWNYIIARSKFLGLDPSICSISGKLDRYGIPVHKIVFDYLQLLKSPTSSLQDRSSMKLDAVAEHGLGIKKIFYPGTLEELYDNDFVKFILYNAVDSILVLLLHRKYKAFMPQYKLAEISHVEMGRLSPIPMLESSILGYLYPQNIVAVPIKKKSKLKQKIKGGYVMDPIPGYHSSVACYDYASLYPTTIRQFNISPDVYLGQKKDLENLNPEEHIVCASGAVFSNKQDGFYRTILSNIYEQRKFHKDNKKEINKEIKRLSRILTTKNKKDNF